MSSKQKFIKNTTVGKKIETRRDSTGEGKVEIKVPVSKELQQKTGKSEANKNKKIIASKKTVQKEHAITGEEVAGMERARSLVRKALSEVDVKIKPVFRRSIVKKTSPSGASQKSPTTSVKVTVEPARKVQSKSSVDKGIGRQITSNRKTTKDWSGLKEMLADGVSSVVGDTESDVVEKTVVEPTPTNLSINLPTNLSHSPAEVVKPQPQPPVFDIYRKPAFIQPITLSGKPLVLKQRKD